MRTRHVTKNSPAPQEPELPRAPGSGVAGSIAGAVAACVLTGSCASAPTVIPGPPPLQQCPPGSKEAIKSFGFEHGDFMAVWMPGASRSVSYDDEVTVTPGRHEVIFRLMKGVTDSRLTGAVFVGDFFLTDRLYARFVEMRLKDGRRLPWCGFMIAPRDYDSLGAPFMPDSKPGAMKVKAIQELRVSEYNH